MEKLAWLCQGLSKSQAALWSWDGPAEWSWTGQGDWLDSYAFSTHGCRLPSGKGVLNSSKKKKEKKVKPNKIEWQTEEWYGQGKISLNESDF
jgi:hypothetical protein